MGSWGPQIFDSDTALDYLGELIDSIEQTIEADLDSMRTKRGRQVIERPTLAALAALSALAKALPPAARRVSRSKVQSWRRAYLAWFDVEMPTASKNWHTERRIASLEFSRLRRRARGK
jgi:hypothetical protein